MFGVISDVGGLVRNGSLVKGGSRQAFSSGTTPTPVRPPSTVASCRRQQLRPLGSGNLTLNGGVLGFYWGAGLTRTLGTGDNQVQILGGESGFGGDGATGPTISLGSHRHVGHVRRRSGQRVSSIRASLSWADADTTNIGITTFSSAIDLNGATRTILACKGLSSGGNRSTISGAISNSTGTAGLIKEGNGYALPHKQHQCMERRYDSQ